MNTLLYKYNQKTNIMTIHLSLVPFNHLWCPYLWSNRRCTWRRWWPSGKGSSTTSKLTTSWWSSEWWTVHLWGLSGPFQPFYRDTPLRQLVQCTHHDYPWRNFTSRVNQGILSYMVKVIWLKSLICTPGYSPCNELWSWSERLSNETWHLRGIYEVSRVLCMTICRYNMLLIDIKLGYPVIFTIWDKIVVRGILSPSRWLSPQI